MRPFCHLVLKAVRVDSPPWECNGAPLRKLLLEQRLQSRLTQDLLAAKLGVSLKTIKNWESGRSKPTREFWPTIQQLIMAITVDPPPSERQEAPLGRT